MLIHRENGDSLPEEDVMGEKTRCISEAVLYNDNFIDLPSSSKALYIYINQKTDDRGFCDEVKSIMRTLGSKPRDLQLLIDREYIIQVKEWLYLEVHFNINNKNLRKDRLKESRFEKYLDDYEVDESGMYKMTTNCNQMTTNCNQMTPQYNITKDNITKDNYKERQEKEIDSVEDLRSFLRGQ